MDRIEQPHRVLGLVRLQLPHQMQAQIGVRLDQCGPFGLRLLHAIFAEHALPLGNQRENRVCSLRFGNGNECNSTGVAPRQCGSARNSCMNVIERRQVYFGSSHACRYTEATRSRTAFLRVSLTRHKFVI